MKHLFLFKPLTLVTLLLILTSYTSIPSGDGYNIGDTVGEIKLKNVDGSIISTSDYKNAKGFIVVFTCNTCPYSKLYETRINDLNLKFADKGYPVLAINSNDKTVQPGDSFEEMVKLAQKSNYSFPYLYDESQEMAKAYGATKTPHVFVLHKENQAMVVKYIGAVDNNARSATNANQFYVEDAVNSLLEGKPIKTTTTKAIGCTIKWKEA
ncbi:redoxin [Reichenbachiella sp. 5M10]|uniref:thioredoxin family protein n=1 Tax=Reichenbachiella sp. 5M10 TaxID=1889772 RepID=UPI000C15D1C2|nr:thioredoxin family protein [Reichenbachiella sp. 5M10]PIB34071.1 redoxin [Reichenbachiella sp. 5M10]